MYYFFPFLVLLLCILPSSAQIVFEETFKKVDAAPDAETVTVFFPFMVEGGEVVEIAEFDTPCSCLSVAITDDRRKWQPQEKGIVTAVFKMGNFKGEVDKHILLRLKGEQTPSEKLTVRVKIPILVEIEPRTLTWSQGEGLVEKSISIVINQEEPMTILEVKPTNQNFTYHLETIKAGRKYAIRITPKKTDQQCVGVIRIHTDAAIEKHRQYTAFVVVKKKLQKSEVSE